MKRVRRRERWEEKDEDTGELVERYRFRNLFEVKTRGAVFRSPHLYILKRRGLVSEDEQDEGD